MDKGDRNMEQFLTDLHVMKDRLTRVRGVALPQTGEREDIQLQIDVLMARLLSCTPQASELSVVAGDGSQTKAELPSTSSKALRGEPPILQETASSPST